MWQSFWMLNAGLPGAFNLVYVGTQILYFGEILKSSIKRRKKIKKECYSKSIPRLKGVKCRGPSWGYFKVISCLSKKMQHDMFIMLYRISIFNFRWMLNSNIVNFSYYFDCYILSFVVRHAKGGNRFGLSFAPVIPRSINFSSDSGTVWVNLSLG